MSVHYKFKSALEYDTVTFDGLHISVKDLKNSIIQQKRIGKSTDFDLQVTNAQTKEVYEDENALIPKNTSLLIARIPVIPQKPKQWEGYGGDNTLPVKLDEGGPIAKAVDLSSLDAPEDDKIRAMMSQSTQDYDPSNYMKIRGANQMGTVPPTYKCYKCHQGGHWIKDCTFGQGADPVEIKKSTGIPRSFMVAVDGPQVPGAMMTPYGQFAVPLVDHQAYNHKAGAPQPVPEPKPDIPEDLVCGICSDLLQDAVMIPCCGNSFCDECVRGVLLESEEHECPDCHEKDIFPDTLIPNRFLRTSVANFKNTTGYVKKPVFKEIKLMETTPQTLIESKTPPPRDLPTTVEEDTNKGPVISEADSTEPVKNQKPTESSNNNLELGDLEKSAEIESIEGPPGVSPRRSPKVQHKHRDDSPRDTRGSPRERISRTKRRSRNRSLSPIKNSRHRRSRSYSGSSSAPPPGSIPTVIGQINPIQPIPGSYPPGQPPPMNYPTTQGPPPNYRFPPPGGAPPYMPPGPYNVPPRPMFDASRPPMSGPPPNFNSNFPPGSRGHRDFRRMMDRPPSGWFQNYLSERKHVFGERRAEASRQARLPARQLQPQSQPEPQLQSVAAASWQEEGRRRRQQVAAPSASRSRSFSGSPPHRQLSPARRSPLRSLPPRGGPSRYRSPIRSPPRSRHRDNDDDRDYGREARRNRDNRNNRSSRERDRGDRFYDNFDDKRGGRQQQWSGGHQTVAQTGYYPPPIGMQQGYQTNRFLPPRDYGPPFNQPLPQTIHSIQPQRQYQDIAPPGVDDDIAPPGVEELPIKTEKQVSPKKEVKEKAVTDKRVDRKEPEKTSDKKRRHDKRSRTPDRARNPSPRRKSKSKDRDSPDKRRRRRRESSDHSDDEKTKKSKDKKKHKEKKESEKKKKRDKKEKHKKESKEKKPKDEFKQIIPKNVSEEEDESYSKSKKKREEQEKLLEERRLEALRNQKKQEEERMFEVNENKRLEEERRNRDKEMQKAERKREELRKLKDREQRFSKVPEKLEENNLTPEPEEVIPDLYGEMSTEDIDTKVVENYGRIENDLLEDELQQEELQQEELLEEEPQYQELQEEVLENDIFQAEGDVNQPPNEYRFEEIMEDGEIKEYEEEEKDVLELHTTDIDLKHELDKSDILAPVPEKSKWEVDEDGLTSPKDSHKSDTKSDKSGKVTNEVLKRAENAIFAKAINAIRPIEIKKIGNDRAKLYSGERDQITVVPAVVKTEITQPPVRLSVKERLGVKVDDTDKIINLSRRSKTVSPFSKRGESGRNVAAGERRVEVDENKNRNRRSRSRRRENSRDKNRNKIDNRHHSRNDKKGDRKGDRGKIKSKTEKSTHADDGKKSKRKRSRTRSVSEDRKDKSKKRDKKVKKEKLKKKDSEEVRNEKEEKDDQGPPQVAAKRKATIDEANFEPDYDESHSEDEQKDKKKVSKKDSDTSSSESDSDSSSEEERKKKKHKKRKKKKKRETSSSSSSSSSESESSESEKDRKKKKHKKAKKKKKKSKHK
ncbi:unnamed protein product [Phaedon cochleariae]|uniref:E3 ubiquitin-protein ligase RBBP6 n=1 Tax=Phaedon cochleariae TaxID=80249 RepID=A0A9N9SLJ7_PHACE|nr:unnamed protein product [Phaedon cochleariae]